MFRDNLDDYEEQKDAQRADMTERDELVERMRKAAISDGACIDWKAALRVAADELLADPTPLEYDASIELANKHPNCNYSLGGRLHAYQVARHILAARRAQLIPAPMTPEEKAVELWERMIAEKHSATTVVFAVLAALKQKEAK